MERIAEKLNASPVPGGHEPMLAQRLRIAAAKWLYHDEG